jgi:hypothetical protein
MTKEQCDTLSSFPNSPPYPRSGAKFFGGKMAMNRQDELTVFKHEIDVSQYAAAMGYEADRSKKWGTAR